MSFCRTPNSPVENLEFYRVVAYTNWATHGTTAQLCHEISKYLTIEYWPKTVQHACKERHKSMGSDTILLNEL